MTLNQAYNHIASASAHAAALAQSHQHALAHKPKAKHALAQKAVPQPAETDLVEKGVALAERAASAVGRAACAVAERASEIDWEAVGKTASDVVRSVSESLKCRQRCRHRFCGQSSAGPPKGKATNHNVFEEKQMRFLKPSDAYRLKIPEYKCGQEIVGTYAKGDTVSVKRTVKFDKVTEKYAMILNGADGSCPLWDVVPWDNLAEEK